MSAEDDCRLQARSGSSKPWLLRNGYVSLRTYFFPPLQGRTRRCWLRDRKQDHVAEKAGMEHPTKSTEAKEAMRSSLTARYNYNETNKCTQRIVYFMMFCFGDAIKSWFLQASPKVTSQTARPTATSHQTSPSTSQPPLQFQPRAVIPPTEPTRAWEPCLAQNPDWSA